MRKNAQLFSKNIDLQKIFNLYATHWSLPYRNDLTLYSYYQITRKCLYHSFYTLNFFSLLTSRKKTASGDHKNCNYTRYLVDIFHFNSTTIAGAHSYLLLDPIHQHTITTTNLRFFQRSLKQNTQ